MHAMVLSEIGQPLQMQGLSVPEPKPQEVLIKVTTCAVCRTDLHVVDGDLDEPKLPLIPGHEIVGTVVKCGSEVADLKIGERVGVPWLGSSCGNCRFCLSGRENLCDSPGFTGYQIDGGYADYTVADARYCFPVPADFPDIQAAPLLCAGLIGYRSLRMAGDGTRLGLYGFGAAAHIVIQIALFEGREVYAFTRPGDREGQAFARSLGACWAGDSDQLPPNKLDAAIIFAPAGELVPLALKAVDRAGIVVCAGIHMTDIPSFPYRDLWEERRIVSVANLTRQDGLDFFRLAPLIPIRTEVQTYPLQDANQALSALREGRVKGAAVLIMPDENSNEGTGA